MPADNHDKMKSKLEACFFGVRGMPLQPVFTSISMGFLSAIIIAVSFPMATEDVILASSGVGLPVTIASFLFLTTKPMIAAARTSMWLDEGGVRWEHGGDLSYWPYELLGRCSVEHQIWGGRAFVIFDRTDRKALVAPLFGKGPEERAHTMAALISEQTARTSATPEQLQPLLRRGRLIKEWINALDEIASKISSGNDYRVVNLDMPTLLKIFRNPSIYPDCRAASAYVLLKLGETSAMQEVRASLREASPPIVLLLATLAQPHNIVLDPGILAKAVRFLDHVDREAFQESARS